MKLKLFMLLLGCKPEGRHTEQHDIFFGIATSLKDLIPDILSFWPDAGKIHIDAWREVNFVDGHEIKVVAKPDTGIRNNNRLFFINLGGYREQEFDELHYKMLSVHTERAGAIKQAKETAFYKHTGFEGAVSHIDDKYGVDVDDILEIEDILPEGFKSRYTLQINPQKQAAIDELHLGYLPLSKI